MITFTSYNYYGWWQLYKTFFCYLFICKVCSSPIYLLYFSMNISEENNIQHQEATQKFHPDSGSHHLFFGQCSKLAGRLPIDKSCKIWVKYCAGNPDPNPNRINDRMDLWLLSQIPIWVCLCLTNLGSYHPLKQIWATANIISRKGIFLSFVLVG